MSFREFLQEATNAQRLEWINDHREAVGRKKFKKLSNSEIRKHERLIDKNAPYGNDPWHDEKE